MAMTECERLAAIDTIGQAKARYFRGVDRSDDALVRSVLAEDCVLDYRGCCTDPASGRDFMPAMNIVLRGRAAFAGGGFAKAGIVSVHHGHQSEIAIEGAESATAVFAMSDRLYMPPGAPFARMEGYGWYHETWRKVDGAWLIATLRIERIRVEES